MKKTILIFIISILAISLTACQTKEKSDALKFKEAYETLNGTENSVGKEHRTVTIKEDNPFLYATAEEILEKIQNKETFYVYFGSPLCPWCRSVIEAAIQMAKAQGVEKIYYVDIWDENGGEILRDKFVFKENQLEQTVVGTDAYYGLLEAFDSLLEDYTVTDPNGNKVSMNEKRIYAPSFIFVQDGEALRLVTGMSSKQTDSRGELTDEIKAEEEDIFYDFFKEDCGC